MKVEKKKCNFWNGYYKCIFPSCDSIVKASIIKTPIENNENIIVNLLWHKTSPAHQLIKKDARCIGEMRKTLAKEVSLNGISKQLVQHTLENLQNPGNGILTLKPKTLNINIIINEFIIA